MHFLSSEFETVAENCLLAYEIWDESEINYMRNANVEAERVL